MPRLFHVTIEKKMDLTFVAESKEELEAALDDADFDDWDGAEWEYHAIDLLDTKREALLPVEIAEPDMGINDGEAVNIDDYEPDHPDYLEQLKAELERVKAEVARLKLEKAKTEPPTTP